MPAAVAYVASAVAGWISGAVYGGLTYLGVSAGTAYLISTYAASLAAGAVYLTAYLGPSVFLAGQRPEQPALESAKEASNQTRAPRRWGMGGKQRLGGPRLLFASIRNHGLDVVHHCEGPIVGYPKTWLHDDEVTPDPVTGVVTALSDGSYGEGKVSVHGTLGRSGQTAIAALTAVAGDLWTSAHKATGCAISALILRKTGDDKITTIYRLGRPRLSRLVEFAVYDFRQDSTVPGGSGPQRRNQPDTWGPSANPVVCLIHNELHRYGASWERRFLPTLEVNRAEADYCDELVATFAGGTEPRYEVHGSFTSADDRAKVRRWYLECMDGSFFKRPDGSIEVRAGRYQPASWSLPARHIVSITKKGGVQKAGRINVLTGSFCSPAHAWTEQQAAALRDEPDIALRGEVADEMKLTLVASHDQWRRLAWRRWLRRKVGATFTVVTNLYGLNWPGHRWITLDALPGGPPSHAAPVEVEVLGVKKIFPLRVEFTLALSTGADIEEPELAAGPGVTERPPLLATPVPTISALTPQFLGEAVVLNATIDPAYPLGLGGLFFGIRWRAVDAGLGAEEGWTAGAPVLTAADAAAVVLQTAALPSGVVYEVQAMAVSGGTRSGWSASVTSATEAPMPPPSSLSAALVGANVQLASTAPTSAQFHHLRFWRGTTAVFASATSLAEVTGSPGNVLSHTDTAPSAGVKYYWVTAETVDDLASAPIGPVPVTVP